MSNTTHMASTPSPASTGLPRPLRGIIPPMITPLRERDQLDAAGLERLVEHILKGGVHGLFVLGTSGEAPDLSYRLRRELITRTCQLVDGRVPVLVGITDTAFVEAVNLAHYAADAGATAVVASTPYYFPAGQPELAHYIRHLVPELPLPLFLYNMPSMTKTVFELETLRQALDLEGVAGIKDSSGNLEYFQSLLPLRQQRPDWSLLVGPEHLLAPTLKMGGQGGINGGANFYPELFVELFHAVETSDSAREAILQAKLVQLGRIYQVGKHASAVIKGMKCAASLLGLCDDYMAEPFDRFNPPEREKVRQVLVEVGLIPA